MNYLSPHKIEKYLIDHRNINLWNILKEKSTEYDKFRLESILADRLTDFKSHKLMRVRAYTMDDKVFKSDWIDTKGLLEYFKL